MPLGKFLRLDVLEMFIGKHSTTLDDQSRISLPAYYLGFLSDGAYITQGFDRNLMVLPRAAFLGISTRVNGTNLADPDARLLRRMLLGNAVELNLDINGYFNLPDQLRSFAGIENEAVLVGQGDFIELWAPSSWQTQETRFHDTEANIERFASLEVSTT